MLFKSLNDFTLHDSISFHVHNWSLRVVHHNNIIIWLCWVRSISFFQAWTEKLEISRCLLYLIIWFVITLQWTLPYNTAIFHIDGFLRFIVFEFTHIDQHFDSFLTESNVLIEVLIAQDQNSWSHLFPKLRHAIAFIFLQVWL